MTENFIPRAWTPIAKRVDGGAWDHGSEQILAGPGARLTANVLPAYEVAGMLEHRVRATTSRSEVLEVRAVGKSGRQEAQAA